MTASDRHLESPAARKLRFAGEVLLLAIIAISPWPNGCVGARNELWLGLGVLALVVVWASHAIVTRRISYTQDAISLCLLAMVLFTAVQLVPLPESVVRLISPTAAQWHRDLTPETPERLPGESGVTDRSHWMALSVSPAATEDLLVRLLAIFLVYATARNFIAPRVSFQRLAWTGFAVGVALSVAGLGQYLSAERARMISPQSGDLLGFGSFVNKNHFAFQVNLLVGLAIGLFLTIARRRGGWKSPEGMALLGGLGLMAVAVVFSQSRGGVVAGLAAAVLVAAVSWSTRGLAGARGARAGIALALGIVVIGGALTVWFGWHGAASRISTLWGDKADNRTADWISVFPLVEQFPVAGVGGGGLSRAEPMVRTRSDLSYEFNTLDNEYLEALVEGGIPRLLLTLALAIAAVWSAIAAFRRAPDSSNGILSLGCAFGLAAVAIQSIGDFGLHTPSVAVTAAIIVGYAQAKGSRRQEPENAPNHRVAFVAAAFLVLAGFLVALADWRLYVVDRLRLAAGTVLRSNADNRYDVAIRYLNSATRVRPNDAAAWDDLASAHLFAAATLQETTLSALIGPFAIVAPSTAPPSGDPDGHITAALKAARASRDAQPLGRTAHLTLGMLADHFAHSEPAIVHFDRAKRVARYDPETWYITGRSAADRGDWSAALADWRESLQRSPAWLAEIARRSASRLPPKQIRLQLLPDDALIWFATTRYLFPDPESPGRTDWLRAAAERAATGPEPANIQGFIGWGNALEVLGEDAAAVRVWRRGIERFPDETEPRDRLAARLEADEQYEVAVPQLEWLTLRHPGNGNYALRLEAARHALALKAEINRR